MNKTMRFALLASATVLLFGLGSGAQAQQSPNMTFFVTSTPVPSKDPNLRDRVPPVGNGGDLGGLAGADAHCQELAAAVGAGNKIWRAYLSTADTPAGKGINAKDRIGNGPWQNSKGVVVATSVADLHSANNKLGRENSLNEKGQMISSFGFVPNQHDALTGSTPEGTAFAGSNINMTCNNWTVNGFGKAMLGHIDKRGGADNETQRSWNSTHQSRGCTQDDFVATGGNGLFYCFAQ
jgi:hypothetical protein